MTTLDYLKTYNDCKLKCKKYDYSCEEKFGFIEIKTKFEHWKILPSNGKTALYHQNSVGKSHRHEKNEYHLEFNEKIDTDKIIDYIHDHETSKYTKCYNTFTVNVSSKAEKYLNRNKSRVIKMNKKHKIRALY